MSEFCMFQLFSKAKRIYLDYAATTPISDHVLSKMNHSSARYYANPGSLHTSSREAAMLLESARSGMKNLLGAHNHTVVFARGGTEACNLGIRHALAAFADSHLGIIPHVIISPLEHSSVYELCMYLSRAGLIDVSFLPVDTDGFVQYNRLPEILRPETALVAVQLVNSELGIVQPIKKVTHLVRRYQCDHGKTRFPLVLTDAVQAGDMVDIQVQSLGVDYLALSASKFYGPKSGGIICVPHAVHAVAGVLVGGNQEFGIRPGTEDLSLAIGTLAAYEISSKQRASESARISDLQKYFYTKIALDFPSCIITVKPEHCAPHICHIAIPGVDSEFAVLFFDHHGIDIASQSACSAHDGGVSRVVQHLWSVRGHKNPENYAHLRFSFGRETKVSDIEKTLLVLSKLMQQIYVRA